MENPKWVQDILTRFDSQTAPHSECEISDALHNTRKLQGDQNDKDWKCFVAEWSAFLFMERRNGDSVWNTYFAPMASAKNADGSDFFSPDIKGLDAEVIAHWLERGEESRNPVMRARYYDLVWDLTRLITGQKPSVNHARMAIDSYIEAAEKKFYPVEVTGIDWLERALDLSVSIHDSGRTRRVVDFMFEFYRRVAQHQYMGTWLFLFDNLYGKKFITPEEEDRIIQNLESMLATVSDTNPSEDGVYHNFDPWAAEAASERLARHYRRMKDDESVKRVVTLYGKAFEHLASQANPMLAMAWLQPVAEKYAQEGLKAEAERIQVLSSEKGKHIDSDLKQVSINVEIKQEDIDNLIEHLLGSGDLQTSLGYIAAYFVPKTNDARQLLDKLKTNAPLMSTIPIAVIETDGHTRAQIGSIEDDPDGRLHHQLAQTIRFYQPFLVLALDKLKERYGRSVDDIVKFLALSPLFGQSQGLLREGLVAYYNGDFIKAIHVLVPQIEHTLRSFLGSLGIPTLRFVPRHPGIQDAKGMNEILGDERLRQILTEDLWRYLTVLYIDKRGLNLRNDLAHGLVPEEAFNRHIADRVFHSLLALSLMRASDQSK